MSSCRRPQIGSRGCYNFVANQAGFLRGPIMSALISSIYRAYCHARLLEMRQRRRRRRRRVTEPASGAGQQPLPLWQAPGFTARSP